MGRESETKNTGFHHNVNISNPGIGWRDGVVHQLVHNIVYNGVKSLYIVKHVVGKIAYLEWYHLLIILFLYCYSHSLPQSLLLRYPIRVRYAVRPSLSLHYL